MAEDQRKQLLIDRKLQIYFLKLILGACTLCVLAMLFSSFGFYYSIKEFYERSENPQLLQILNFVHDYLWIYFVYMSTALVLCAMIIVYAWLIATNRFAGPVYRIQKNLENYITGDSFDPIKLRDHDELQNLATTVNTAIAKAQGK